MLPVGVTPLSAEIVEILLPLYAQGIGMRHLLMTHMAGDCR
jgi:hypothetical protein